MIPTVETWNPISAKAKLKKKKKNLNLKDLLQSIQIEKLINVEGAMKSDIPLSSKIEKEHKRSKQSEDQHHASS